MFKDARVGQTLYFFDQVNCSVEPYRIVSVGATRLEANYNQAGAAKAGTPGLPVVPGYNPSQATMVVDITVDANGGQKTYTVRDTGELCGTTNGLVSCDLSIVLKEIEARKAVSEDALARTDYHKECVGKCEELLTQYDPSKKEKMEIDTRITKIEDSVNNLTTVINNFISEWKK